MPSSSPEMGGGYQRQEVQPIGPEKAPQPNNVEVQPNSTERQEVQQHTPADPIVVPAAPAQPFLPAPSQAQAAPAVQPQAGNPLVAADDDLIEKEWVDKAKKIIQQTKSDPYTQEREVSKLQADYIKKRYGKDVKLPNE